MKSRASESDRMRTTQISVLTAALLASLSLSPIIAAHAAIELTSQHRGVLTFALVDPIEGETVFTNDSERTDEQGHFEEGVESEAAVDDARAHSFANLLSELSETTVTAFGEFDSEATLGTVADFAEALGSSEVRCTFLVDAPTPLSYFGTISAEGNGTTNLALIHHGEGTIFYHSIQEQTLGVGEDVVLEPGSYELLVGAGGYGQALPGGEFPAAGSFQMYFLFSPTADVAASQVDGREVVISPNPVTREATIRLAGSAGVERTIGVFDARGRLVRRLALAHGNLATWDTRDELGRRVAPGLYFARIEGIEGSRRIVVLKP